MDKGLPEDLERKLADLYCDNISNLPDTIKRKLSMADYHVIYETNVGPLLRELYKQARINHG